MKLNCDLGEYDGNDLNSPDEQIMPYIDMANIACGKHAGNLETMTKTVALAVKHNVQIGAHPSYDDKENFGRVSIEMPKSNLIELIGAQLFALQRICQLNASHLSYVKPHGALYNDMMVNLDIFDSVCQAVSNLGSSLSLLIQAIPNTIQHKKIANKYNIELMYEAFADRNYLATGLLVPRRFTNAVIINTDEVINRCKQLVKEQTLHAVDGTLLAMQADSLCVHGDNKKAIDMVIALQQHLKG